MVICCLFRAKRGNYECRDRANRRKILNELLEQARDEGLILQSANGQRFLLVSIENWMSFDVGDAEDFEEEVKSTGENQELMKFLAERRRDKSRIPLAEVKEELGIE